MKKIMLVMIMVISSLAISAQRTCGGINGSFASKLRDLKEGGLIEVCRSKSGDKVALDVPGDNSGQIILLRKGNKIQSLIDCTRVRTYKEGMSLVKKLMAEMVEHNSNKPFIKYIEGHKTINYRNRYRGEDYCDVSIMYPMKIEWSESDGGYYNYVVGVRFYPTK